MARRWSLVGLAAAAVVALGLLARVDGGEHLPVEADPATRDAGGDEPAPGWIAVGSWWPMANSPGGPRRDHTAVWTGGCPPGAAPRSCGEVLLWGGRKRVVGPRADGVAYHPASDTWRRLPAAPREPLDWASVPGVWTGVDPAAPYSGLSGGGELILWGPTNADFGQGPPSTAPRAVAYDPAADSWRSLPEAPIAPRTGHTLTWTGAEVIAWGGRRPGEGDRGLVDGAAYDPATDTWRRLPDAPLAARRNHVAVWLPDAGRLVVWGGIVGRGDTAAAMLDGAAYDPVADAWEPLPEPAVEAPAGRDGQAPAATRLVGPERLLVVASLQDPRTRSPVIAVYEPTRDRWRLAPAGPLAGRGGGQAHGGDRILVWDAAGGEREQAGVLYDPATDAWRTAPDGWGPVPGASATWTGAVLITWGGTGEGALWNPDAHPDRQPLRATRHHVGETRLVVLPPGNETGWRLDAPAALEAHDVEVHGGGGGVDVWLEARSAGGGRSLRLPPAAVDCVDERCVHRFDALPRQLPGPLDLRVRNTGAEQLTVGVTLRS